MAYSKKLIHFATRANFDAQLAANNILGTSICFIKDAKQIWTHGLFYSCPFTEEEIEQLFVGSKIKLDGYIEMASPINILETDTVNEAFGKIEDFLTDLTDLTDLNAILVDTGDVASDPTINDYITPSELTNSLSTKVDKITGKGLSTEDFTTALKNKLNDLSNYDDTAINNAVSSLQTQLNTLVSGNPSTAINSFNEIIAFLEGITDSEDLESIIASIEQQIAAKQDKISDLDTIRSGAAKGATALLEHLDISGKLDATTAASTYATKTENNAKQDKNLYFNNKSASSWVASTAYADYGYQCDIACSGVTASMYTEVVFAPGQATSGNYAPVCETFTDKVRIYSKVNTSITIPTISISK